MDRRRYIGFALAYVLIPVGVNAIVATLSFSIIAPLLLTGDEVQKLNTAMQSDDFTLQFFSYMSFIFPTSIGYIYNLPLIIYMFKKERPPLSDKIKSIIINLPIVNATVSFAGWGLALLGSFLNFQNNNIHFGTMSTIKYSFFNILMANLCFVFVYYIMDMVNKNFIRLTLVGEHLSEIPKTIKVSIRSRFFIFYITVAVTPCILLVDLILSILNDNQINGYYPQTAFIFLGIIFIGTVLTFFISNSFANPIRELETATSQLQLGNLDASVIVNSNDEIGFLGERFNEMSLSIKEKEFIKDTFGKVVDPTVRDYLLRGNLALGGETRDVSVLFVDIRGFTTISEKIPPADVVSWLNQYFEQMSICIAEEKGLVNKFIGDAILAVFGAPIPLENHAESAVRAGIKMRDSAKSLSKEFLQKGFPELKIGIGIHSGKVLAGNIGSMTRLEYTVIGDTVNIASRLESHCKEAGKDLLITENTKIYLKDLFQTESIGKIQVRGRESEIGIYSL